MRSRDRLSTLLTAVLILCALTVTGLVVRREFASAADSKNTTVSNWQRYASVGHRMGPERAAVIVTVFSDFECPACRILAANLDLLRARYPEDLAVIYRHFPLASHAHAAPAARASECAAEQGRFREYHDALFADQDSLGLWSWERFAANAQMPDSAAFARCIARDGSPAALARDSAAANELGVRGTPMLLINGARVDGTPPLPTLERLVLEARGSRAPSARARASGGSTLDSPHLSR
jgi:protein-disulfide isomerase